MGWPKGRSAAEDGEGETPAFAGACFLASRGMGEPGLPPGLPGGVESPGEESRSGAVAAQTIEAQPSFGQIKP